VSAARRSVLLVSHTSRTQIIALAQRLSSQLREVGFDVCVLAGEESSCGDVPVTIVDAESGAKGAELVLVLGGDGTFLRAAELARPARTPLLGVNLGHVGFLAQVEPGDLATTVEAIVERTYSVEDLVTVEADVIVDGRVVERAWALNEASLERTNRERMIEIGVAIDGHPLLRFGCDGVLCSTPTGSTAYAFSAGGPIVWPDVDALVIVPNAAHALFSRAIVVAPDSVVEIELLSAGHDGVLSCDGRRSVDVPSGAIVRIRRGEVPVRIASTGAVSFADRLVRKFHLPVKSLREAARPPDVDGTELDPPLR